MLLLATLLRPRAARRASSATTSSRDRAAIRRRLGLVFQEPSIDGLLTVEENLLFAAGLMGLGGTAARQGGDEALRATGSDGAGIAAGAAALRRLAPPDRHRPRDVHRPDLLILDEPTVGLDPEHRDRMWSAARGRAPGPRRRPSCSPRTISPKPRRATASFCSRTARRGRGHPAALKATVGEQVVEIEGPDAERAVHAHRGLCASRRCPFGPSAAIGSASAARTASWPRSSARRRD